MRADTEVIGIDEGQFFDAGLPGATIALARRGIRVIVAGLDQDYLGKPFEPMPQLLAIAEYITKTRAICMVCGNPANHTQRLVGNRARVLLGAQGTYEARCRRCFDPTLAETEEQKQQDAAESVAKAPARSRDERRATRSGARGQPRRAGRVVPGRQPARRPRDLAVVAPPRRGAPGVDAAEAARTTPSTWPSA